MKALTKMCGDDDKLKRVLQNSHSEDIQSVQIYYSSISAMGMFHFSTEKWTNLKKLVILSKDTQNCIKIQSKGCKFLSKTQLPNITEIALCDQQIDTYGLWHLAKAQWNRLQSLSLRQNKIARSGIEKLVRANWKNLDEIILAQNKCLIEDFKNFLLSQATKMNIDYTFNFFIPRQTPIIFQLFEQKGYIFRIRF